MLRPTLSDFVQNEDEPTQTLDSVLEQLQNIDPSLQPVKPGYSNRFSNSNSPLSEFTLAPNLRIPSRLYNENTNYYSSIADDSKIASPAPQYTDFDDKVKDFLKKESKQDVSILKQIHQSFPRMSQKMALKDNCLFQIQCSSSRLKMHKREQYVIFCQDIDSKKYSTCIQEDNLFKYYMGGEELYQMEFRKECYYLKPSHNLKSAPYKFYHKSQRNNPNPPSSSKTSSSHKPTILLTSCTYQNKNIESKPVNYNNQFHIPYISSKSFDLKNTTPSMLNTLIINSTNGEEICAVFEREDKIYVEFAGEVEVLKNVVLMMAVSRIDARRRSCAKEA